LRPEGLCAVANSQDLWRGCHIPPDRVV